jgi:hypothetical protein
MVRLDEIKFSEHFWHHDRAVLCRGRVIIDRNNDGTWDIWGGVRSSAEAAREARIGVDALTAQCVLLDYLARYK